MDMEPTIRLREQNGETLTLPVTREARPYSAERVLAAACRQGVRENLHYDLELPAQWTGIQEAAAALNGKPLNSLFDSRRHMVLFPYNIFAYHMGLVELELTLRLEDGSQQMWYTDLLPVLIQPSPQQENLKAMVEFIYAHQGPLLREKGPGTAGPDRDGFQDFLSQLTLAEETLQVYEENYGYFKANCRHTLESAEVVDWTERVQTVSPHTLQYLVRHPEHLKEAPSGIPVGNRTVLPEKLLSTQDKMSRDVYENQVVVSFLQRMLYDIGEEGKEIRTLLREMDLPDQDREGYRLSSQVLYENAAHMLRSFLERCEEVEERLQEMFVSYRQILPVTLLDASHLPRPTEPFFRVPQYYRIYLCIHRWYQTGCRHFPRERMLLNLYENTFVFEIYCLARLLHLFRQEGFVLEEGRHQEYSLGNRHLYDTSGYQNVYRLRQGGEELTLYFQPVITDHPEEGAGGIHLYRNTTYAFKALEEGHYYTPDYLLKWKSGNRETYLILDAKYSYRKKVLQELMPEMSYKYLLSLSPVPYEEEGKKVEPAVRGLEILYGLTNGEQELESFYNCRLPGTSILPAANVIPFAETVTEENQQKNIRELLREMRG